MILPSFYIWYDYEILFEYEGNLECAFQQPVHYILWKRHFSFCTNFTQQNIASIYKHSSKAKLHRYSSMVFSLLLSEHNMVNIKTLGHFNKNHKVNFQIVPYTAVVCLLYEKQYHKNCFMKKIFFYRYKSSNKI